MERWVPGVGITQLRVTNGRLAAALIAQKLAGDPAEKLFLAAVTGTNGKTTTAWIARHLLDTSNRPAASIGTVGVVRPGGDVVEGSVALTTPGPVELAERLREFVDDGVRSVVLEASSHALEQYRLDGIRFDAAVFTNLTRDHLDYHETFESYLEAKSRLAELLSDNAPALVKADEDAWKGLPIEPARRQTFGVDQAADLQARGLEPSPAETRFVLEAAGEVERVHLPLLGRYNVENALGAVGIGLAAGIPLTVLVERLQSVPQVPGRLEVVVREPFTVVIDFAHTPAALEGVLTALRGTGRGRLIVVFGAGGDRDREKRPLMGAVVAAHADLPVVTSDNPRTEDPAAIVEAVAQGVGAQRHLKIVDRREAIRAALDEARPGDLVLLAGKGHEQYQVIGQTRVPFDERAIVREALGEAA